MFIGVNAALKTFKSISIFLSNLFLKNNLAQIDQPSNEKVAVKAIEVSK